jgi:ribonuclease HI
MILHTYSDGGARGNPGPAAIGYVICNPRGEVVKEGAECIGAMTNNKAEYRAMLKAMETAKALKPTKLLCHADSELIVYQLQGLYRIKDAQLKILAEKVKSVAVHFQSVQWKQVPREHPMIRRADKLLNQALDKARARAPAYRTGRPASRELKAPAQGEFF